MNSSIHCMSASTTYIKAVHFSNHNVKIKHLAAM